MRLGLREANQKFSKPIKAVNGTAGSASVTLEHLNNGKGKRKTKSIRLRLTAITAVLGALIFSVKIVPAQIIQIDGSSTVFPITKVAAEEFQKAKRGAIKITVGISGTGGGFRKFCRGETDISDASRPILKQEMQVGGICYRLINRGKLGNESAVQYTLPLASSTTSELGVVG